MHDTVQSAGGYQNLGGTHLLHVIVCCFEGHYLSRISVSPLRSAII
jgi:hypothetical protein